MKPPANGFAANPCEGERRSINPELWHACAGPLVSLPPVGSLVVYFPQGHSEQVAASMQKESDGHIPNYPNLPSKLICLLHNVTLHADAETDEVYAQMTLQPVTAYDKETLLASDLALKSSKPLTEFFCKTLTASDTSTHGGFSVPRRAAEKIFPSLDFTIQPPAQELVAKDLHDNAWSFRHIYRGQPKRHLLTTGWSQFVSGKRLFAGDSVLFIRDEKGQLLLGIRRANRQPTNISSSVLSSDSMHIGILAAAAHAAANHSPFTVFYNPRASPSEFVIPLAKYNKAVYSNQITLGMRFRMMFETEDSGTRRYMGTITGISDLDPVRWKNSQWRNLQVGWDESTAGERRNRVSIWEIEPVTAPFFICPPPFFRPKRPRQPGMPEDESDMESLFKRTMPWLGGDMCMKDPQTQNSMIPGLSLVQWMSMQQNPPPIANPVIQPDYLRSLTGPVLQSLAATDLSRQLGLQAHLLQQNNLQFNTPRPNPQAQQAADQLQKLPVTLNQLGAVKQHLDQVNQQQQRQNLVNPIHNQNQMQTPFLQPQMLGQNHVQQQNSLIQAHQLQGSLCQNLQTQQHGIVSHTQSQVRMPGQQIGNIHQQAVNQQLPQPEHQIQLQLLQKIQQQQQSLLLQPVTLNQSNQTQLQDQQRQLLSETQQQLTNPHLISRPHLIQQQQQHQQHQQHHQQQQILKNTQVSPPEFSQPLQHQQPQQKLLQQPTMLAELPGPLVSLPPSSNLLPATPGNCALTAGAQSGLTDDVPSCSTSPSTNNCPVLPQSILTRAQQGSILAEVGPSTGMLGPCTLEAIAAGPNMAKEMHKSDVKPSISVSKAQNQPAQQMYLSPAQMDYLDTSSSATSVCLSQPEGSFQQNFMLPNFNPSAMLYRDTGLDGEGSATDPRNNVLFGVNIENQLGIPLTPEPLMVRNVSSGKDLQNLLSTGKDLQNLLSSGSMLASYGNPKEAQPELSSSIVSQSFGVPDVTFNQGVSIDSTINDGNLLNRGPWAQPQFQQRKRTFTKVFKRGAAGRCIDVTRYKGYDDLQQHLAHLFGIEGQLEDRQRIGWKLVYVDHENDVLLVGDDPWEEFVNCVRCIRILSPQEVQQMSLDGDLGNSVLPNQACSSSDGGNAWRAGQGDQTSGNPSAGSYDH